MRTPCRTHKHKTKYYDGVCVLHTPVIGRKSNRTYPLFLWGARCTVRRAIGQGPSIPPAVHSGTWRPKADFHACRTKTQTRGSVQPAAGHAKTAEAVKNETLQGCTTCINQQTTTAPFRSPTSPTCSRRAWLESAPATPATHRAQSPSLRDSMRLGWRKSCCGSAGL